MSWNIWVHGMFVRRRSKYFIWTDAHNDPKLGFYNFVYLIDMTFIVALGLNVLSVWLLSQCAKIQDLLTILIVSNVTRYVHKEAIAYRLKVPIQLTLKAKLNGSYNHLIKSRMKCIFCEFKAFNIQICTSCGNKFYPK